MRKQKNGKMSTMQKVLIVLAAFVCGMLMTFIWPFALAILWNILMIALPVMAAVFIIMCYEAKKEEDRRRENRRKKTENVRAYAPEVPPSVKDWYESYGRAKLIAIVQELGQEGVHAAWISDSGRLNISAENSFIKHALLQEFPKGHMKYIAERIRKDGIAYARVEGKYIYVTWKENRRSA